MKKLIPYPGYITDYENTKRTQKPPCGADLYHLRDAELDPKLAAMLSPFINAYRPEGRRKEDVPKTEDLKEKGYELVRNDTFTDDLKEVYWDLRGYYPEENPELEGK